MFTAIPSADDECQRMLAFIRWYISALNASFSSRVPKGEWEKKPYNPVLGERWFATWGAVGASGETQVVCEQVSHHPPVTAFYIHNDKHKITLNGHSGQKTRFSGTSLICDQTGRGLVTLGTRDNETYMFTHPSLTVNGIWYAAPYVELTGTNYIQSSTNYYTTIEFSSKGWISGEKNHFKSHVYKNGDKNYTYKVEGQWSGKSTLTAHGSKASEPFLDVAELRPAQLYVKPLEEQGPLESRRVWQKVSVAIRAGDVQTAGEEKSAIENEQRAQRKQREQDGIEWKPELFQWVEKEPHIEQLCEKLSSSVKIKHNNGVLETGNWVHKHHRQ